MNERAFHSNPISGEPIAGDWAAPRDPRSLLGRLAQKPHRFEPFQALRLIEAFLPGVRFANSIRKSHLGHPIGAITQSAEDKTATVDLIGLIGPKGTMPTPYLDQAIVEKRRRNRAFGVFLDIFSDQIIRLFGRASEKYHLAGQLSRAHTGGQAKQEPAMVDFIYALCGFGAPDLRGRLSLPDDVVIYYAGLLTQRPPSWVNLRNLLADFLGLPVKILPFRTRWLDLPAQEQTSLKRPASPMAVLGKTAISGSRVSECQSHFRIVVGPCGRADFESFSAGSRRLRQVGELVTLFVGLDKTFDLQVILRREDVPACRLGGEEPVTLGWNTWPANLPLDRDPDEAVHEHAVLTASLRQSNVRIGSRKEDQ